GVLDAAALEQLLDDAVGGVAGDREADPDRAAAAAAGLDLRVDADHLAVRVEQRAARVTRVDRRVGLDHVADLEAVRSLDLALKRGHDPRRRRAVEAERVPDRDHGVADLDVRGVVERKRVKILAAGINLEQREVARRILADNLRAHGGLVAELDRDVARALDDVVVGEDVPVLVDHEPGAGRGPLRGAAERRRLLLDLRLDERDAGGGRLVDLVDGLALDGARRGG